MGEQLGKERVEDLILARREDSLEELRKIQLERRQICRRRSAGG
jgi:hypothetical protein